ncbi:MAG: trimethylamine methyltransferase family protein [Candidatus Bathyarchaeia archaeon]
MGFSRENQRITFSVLSKEDLEAIHQTTLEVLATTGFKINSKKCLTILEEGDCEVDYKNQVALMPSYLVEEALRKNRKSITLCARNPKYDVNLDQRHVYITTDGNGTQTIDMETGERRASTKEDIAKSAIISDAIDVVDIYWPLVSAQDYPAHVRHLHDLEASLSNTEKHVTFETTMSSKEARYQIEMASVVVGGEKKLRKKPIISSLHCTSAPLQMDGNSMEAALEFSKAGVPVMFFGMPQLGATGPATLAGSMVVNNAEVLGCLVITQLACPGASVVYGAGIAAFDMRTLKRAGGGPEHGLTGAAAGELARYYGMPSIVGGFVSTAKAPGAQACYEKFTSGFPPVLSGCGMIAGIGLLDDCTTLAFEEILIDAEIVRIIFRIAQGIEVSNDTLALNVIRKVGPGGNFLGERHTLEHIRKEHFIPQLTDRRSFETWLRDGAKDIVKMAREKVKIILQRHQVQPLEVEVQKEIKNIIEIAKKDLVEH